MQTITVRGVTLGTGRPKIIVPIVGRTQEEILAQAAAVSAPADLVEWRVDWFDGCFDPSALLGCLRALRAVLGELPLLVTFRTAKEGGAREITPAAYAALCKAVAASGDADLLDVEAFSGDALVTGVISAAHAGGVFVVASNHDFQKTPPREELLARLEKMQDLGADLPKLAVMPQSPADVLTLLSATEEFVRCRADRPVITMSMGGLGVISRVAGQTFGSAATFGCAGQSSAPGQLELHQLDRLLAALEQAN